MASVWSGVHETIGRPVAVKFIHAKGPNAEVTIARFMQEARIAAAVQHRFVVDIFDFGQTEKGEPYMVMELLNGEALSDRMTRGPPMPLKSFVRVITQTLSGLDAVHNAGIVHRDLKPENVYLLHDADGLFPKLLDFGISRSEESFAGEKATRLTKEGTLLGTPWYMSPEQVRGRHVDGRSDIYSVGVIMYEALTGQLPFDAEAVGDLLVKIATTDAAPVHALRPDLPRPLSDIIAKAMARDPADRYDNSLSMRIALQALEDALPETAFTVVIERAPSEPPRELGSGELLPAGASSDSVDAAVPRSIAAATIEEPLPDARRSRPIWPFALGGAAVLAAAVAVVASGGSAETAESPAETQRSSEIATAAAPTPIAAEAPAIVADAGATAAPTATAPGAASPDPTPMARPARRRPSREAARPARRAAMATPPPNSFRDPGF